MNMTDVATWGQLISSAAVLVTLVYLAVQTKQTATLMRSESRQSLIEQDMHLLSVQMQWPTIVTDWFVEGEITMENKARLWSFLFAFMRTREHQWLQYKSGVLDEATWEAYLSATHIVIGSERNRSWWTTMGRHSVFDPVFAEAVDAVLEGQPYTDMQGKLIAWK